MIEKVFKREDGTQIQLRVKWVIKYDSLINAAPDYDFHVMVKHKGKRKWVYPVDKSSWEYRAKSPRERQEIDLERCMELITKEELHSTKMELWESIKPAK